jgi:hypothetical protein
LHFATLFFLTIVIFIYSSLLTPSSIKSTIWWTTLYVIFTASSLIHHLYTSIAAIVATLLLWSLARHIQVMQGSFLCCYGGFNHSLLAVSIHRHSTLAAIAATTFTLHHVERRTCHPSSFCFSLFPLPIWHTPKVTSTLRQSVFELAKSFASSIHNLHVGYLTIYFAN